MSNEASRGSGRRPGRGRGRGRGRGGRGRSGRGTGGRGGRGRGRSQRYDGTGEATSQPAYNPPNRQPNWQQPQKPVPTKPQGPVKKNGEKGAEAFTIEEADRIRFTQMLLALRESHWESTDPIPKVEFPPTLTNTERKFIHQLASQLGLHSKSSGKGESRRIAIYPSKNNAKNTAEDGDDLSGIPSLRIGDKGIKALQQHFQKHPPSKIEAQESRDTGSSLVDAMQNNKDNNDAVKDALSQMGLQVNNDKDNKKQYKHSVKPIDLERRKQHHEAAQRQKKSNQEALQAMMNMRAQLPASKHQDEIVKKVNEHQVTIISGDTGCGKSTQVPQFVLDANPTSNIVVTQPRRIAAISIAERVAYEQLQTTTGGQVGFKVRLESSQSDKTQLMFMTPGVLLRHLQRDPYLQEYTHIIMDEVHERDQYQEFLLIVLRDLLPQRPDLRLILMSATLQTEKLVEYFLANNDSTKAPARVEMEGRMFPVQEFFLEHVLDMTGFISVTEDEIEGKVQTGIATMTDDQLERELAAFTKSEIQPEQTKVHPKLRCVLCRRKDFKDAVELGTHLALCDGGGDDDSFDPGAGDKQVSAPSFGGNNVGKQEQPDQGDLLQNMKFEDYDVDGEYELDDFEFEINGQADASSNSDESEAEAADDPGTEKWDGQSAFPANLEATEVGEGEVVVTKREEAILKQYQASHDDAQIDNFLLLETIRYICQSSYGDGAILVFLPGWQEISECTVLLESTPPFSNRNKYWVLPLHSGVPVQAQRKVLSRPPTGIRKIVLATNLAETSLTIDDISFVVDSGRAKEKSYDPHLKTSTLQPTWISAASAKQRKGRAGRVKRGVCFHLFSQRRHQSMRPFVDSELLRTPLEEICLQTKQLFPSCDIPAFLAKAMSAPHARSISNALELLVDLGAMQPETNNLTDLGECLAMLSLEPRVGKMVVWSYLLGCARVAADMAVAMSYKSPFTLPPPHQRKAADGAKVQLSYRSESDQLTVHYLLEKRAELMRANGRQQSFAEFCRKNFIGVNVIQMISEVRKNLTRELSMLGFPSPALTGQPNQRRGGGGRGNISRGAGQQLPYHNRHDNEHALWHAAIAAGLYPNVALRKRGDVNFSTRTNQKVKVHISSVNAVKGQPLNAKSEAPKGQLEFVCFGEMVKGTAQFFTVNQTTHLSSPLPLLLLCGTSLNVRPCRVHEPEDDETMKPSGDDNNSKSILTLDDWIIFQCDSEVAAHIVMLRKRLDSAFWHAIANSGFKRSNNSNAAGKNLLSRLGACDRDAIETLGPVLQSAHVQSEAAKSSSPAAYRR
ncbi:DExH-box ATP-dependent RNA helicase DExH1 [Seminavis robusta]|uniref:DExH-box ATP-dependent RNA helicase DExH1 n=1 Tax=Seminavis robusta TaxID=568900 RepID=A0A9N8HAV0_9STRA|nr:DExH-box ATP-dependent RNA helicase DExH1 [Seminavis robusta]|eukprot:Sro335_g119970.1 DExH-box ATP-dependent RNA helicase DExH1 (1298) ;mRNA; f:4439-8728